MDAPARSPAKACRCTAYTTDFRVPRAIEKIPRFFYDCSNVRINEFLVHVTRSKFLRGKSELPSDRSEQIHKNERRHFRASRSRRPARRLTSCAFQMCSIRSSLRLRMLFESFQKFSVAGLTRVNAKFNVNALLESIRRD